MQPALKIDTAMEQRAKFKYKAQYMNNAFPCHQNDHMSQSHV